MSPHLSSCLRHEVNISDRAAFVKRLPPPVCALRLRSIHFPDLLKPHRSVLRNPLIAKAFFLNGAIESWGRGTLKILELCRNAGLPEPEYAENSGGIEVRFAKPDLAKSTVSTLNDTQIKILSYLDKHTKVRINELALELHVHRSTIQRNLKDLDHLIEWVGKSRNDPRGYLRKRT